MVRKCYARIDDYINNNLREARLSSGLIARDIALFVGISVQGLFGYERLRAFPCDEIAQRISEVLERPVDYLFPKYLHELTLDVNKERKEKEKRRFETVPLSTVRGDNLVSDSENPLVYADEEFLRDALSNYFEKLTPIQRKVVYLRHGLENEGVKSTLEEVGKIFNVSRERIRQIEEEALERLRIFIPKSLSRHVL